MELRGGGKGKKSDRESTILKYFPSVQAEDICTKSCQKIGVGKKVVKESNSGG
jgi:hypothetical protein